jgi:DNA-binding MarR family transcriptional regulator
MLQRMEQAGLVERRPDPVDQRTTRVYLSPAGRAIRGDLQQREQQVGEEMLQDFRPEELAQLAEHLDRMRSNLLRINNQE